jgi:predicted dehydrogenase
MGVYPLAFAQLFLGEPSEVAAVASLTDAGVDQNLALSLGFPDGAVAALTASMTGWTPRTASIATDRGRFDLPNGFHHPTTATWTALDGDPDFDEAAGSVQISEDVIGTGLANEAAEVIRCLRSGETESPLVPLADTVALLRLTDRIRAQIGVRYDGDR